MAATDSQRIRALVTYLRTKGRKERRGPLLQILDVKEPDWIFDNTTLDCPDLFTNAQWLCKCQDEIVRRNENELIAMLSTWKEITTLQSRPKGLPRHRETLENLNNSFYVILPQRKPRGRLPELADVRRAYHRR